MGISFLKTLIISGKWPGPQPSYYIHKGSTTICFVLQSWSQSSDIFGPIRVFSIQIHPTNSSTHPPLPSTPPPCAYETERCLSVCCSSESKCSKLPHNHTLPPPSKKRLIINQPKKMNLLTCHLYFFGRTRRVFKETQLIKPNLPNRKTSYSNLFGYRLEHTAGYPNQSIYNIIF